MDDNSDPLRFVMKLLKMNLWKSTTFRIFTVLVSITIEGCNVACFLTERNNFHQYMSLVLITQPGILSTITSMFFSSKLEQMLIPSTKDFWPIHAAGVKVKNKILQRSRVANIFIVTTIASIISGYFITFLPIVGDENQINSLEMIPAKYFGRWSPLFSAVIYVYYPIFAIGLLYPYILIIYLIVLVSFQLSLLKERIKLISDVGGNLGVHGNYLLYSRSYQDMVQERLVSCIQHHIRLLRFRNMWVNHSKLVMLSLPIASLAPVGSGYFLFHQISPPSNFRFVLTLLAFAMSIATLCFIGQHFEDSYAEIFRVTCNCPWIYWNQKNKKTLLVLLMNSSKPVEISSYTKIAINYQLLMKFYKWIYSLITLMR